MANNFRLTGTHYVSKDGNIANAGTDPNLPKKTLSGVPNTSALIVVGCGFYNGDNFVSMNGFFNRTVLYDGICYFNYTSNINLGVNTGAGNATLTINPNQEYYIYMNGNTFAIDFTGASGQIRSIVVYNTVFENISGFNTGNLGTNTFSFFKSVFKNIVFNFSTATNSIGVNFYNSAIINSTITYPSIANTIHRILGCWVDSTSIISMGTYYSTPSTHFVGNNFQGQIVVAGTPYELKRDKTGVLIPSRIGNGIADLDLLPIYGGTGLLYTRDKNFAQDPQFVNLAKGDYWSVQSTSPNLIVANSKFVNIGNCKLQNTIAKADDTDYFDITDSANGEILLSGGDLIFDATAIGLDQDSIPSKKIDLGKVMVLENITATMLLAFDSDAGIGTATNTNVLQVIRTHPTTTAGANPQRLTYKMRWTKNPSMPMVDADWDNQGYVTAGQYGIFEINAGAKVSSLNGVISTSGEPTFNNLNSAFVVARWVQFELYINEGIEITP
jgi:hypothetical protein